MMEVAVLIVVLASLGFNLVLWGRIRRLEQREWRIIPLPSQPRAGRKI